MGNLLVGKYLVLGASRPDQDSMGGLAVKSYDILKTIIRSYGFVHYDIAKVACFGYEEQTSRSLDWLINHCIEQDWLNVLDQAPELLDAEYRGKDLICSYDSEKP